LLFLMSEAPPYIAQRRSPYTLHLTPRAIIQLHSRLPATLHLTPRARHPTPEPQFARGLRVGSTEADRDLVYTSFVIGIASGFSERERERARAKERESERARERESERKRERERERKRARAREGDGVRPEPRESEREVEAQAVRGGRPSVQMHQALLHRPILPHRILRDKYTNDLY